MWFFKGRIPSFNLDKIKEKLKAVTIPSPVSIIARVTKGNKESLHVHNRGLDADVIKQLFEKLEEKFKKRLESGSKNKEENDQLKIQLAGVQAKLAHMEKALADRKIVLAETQKALQSAELKNAVSEGRLADARKKLKQGDSSEADILLAQILQDAENQAIAGAEAAFRLGKLAYDRIDYKAARDYYIRAAQLAPGNAFYLNHAGFMVNTMGHYDKAIEYFGKALGSDLRIFGPDHPEVAIDWNYLGLAWDFKGEYDKAIEYFGKALASDLKTFGPDHPQVAIYWNNLGGAWYSKENYDKAIEYFGKALASNLKTFGPEHPTVARDWNNLGGTWGSRGQYDKAIVYCGKALAIFKEANLPHKAKTVKKNILVLKNQR